MIPFPHGFDANLVAHHVLDDIVLAPDGSVYISDVLTANQDLILVSGLNNPQGIIFDRDGNLIVTDLGNRRLLKVLIHQEIYISSICIGFGKNPSNEGCKDPTLLL